MSWQTPDNNNNNNNNMMMMVDNKLRHFLIQLDQGDRVFQPGDLVSGRLIVDLREEISFNKIKLELAGGAEVHWTETDPVRPEVTKH